MDRRDTPRRGRPVAAFVICLIAGLWMLGMGGMAMGWGAHMARYGWGVAGMHEGAHSGDWGPWHGWMWQHHQLMHGYGGGMLWGWIALAAGATVVAAALVFYSRPSAARSWGIVVLVASGVDLLAGAGGFLAAILGIVGGILAVTWRP